MSGAWILPLGHPGCQEATQTGSKAANLAALAGDFPVPPGFAITTAAGQALAADPALLPAIRGEITSAYEALAVQRGQPSLPVAVRSSGVEEDGQATSFAGIHESFLNRQGAAAVWLAVENCWRSAHAERALAYRQRQGLAGPGQPIAVLVQALVQADVAGVAFSFDPVRRQAGTIVVAASWGLGESVVGGTVTPDTYHLDKRDLQIKERAIARKLRMTVTTPAGTAEVAVPNRLQDRPCLAEEQVQAVAALAHALEVRQGWPVDIEYAFAGEALYLLQCRPVTGIH